jgi:uncharacterized protein (TIGR00288 family)
MNPNPRVMVLIDADNVSADVLEQALAKVIEEHGAAHVRRAYCTAEGAVKQLMLFKRLSIRPIVNVSTGKNSTDIALAVDAIDLVLAERPDVVVIVSSDSDFAPLVIRLREKGCRVEGIGQAGKTGEESTQVYDHFIDLAHRKARTSAKTGRTGRAARADDDVAPAPVEPAATEPAKRAPRRRAGATAAAPKATAPAAAHRRAAPAWPEDVQAILDAVPSLRDGGLVELRVAAESLRKAKLLSKTGASTKVFKKHASHFELHPHKQPNQVRFLGTSRG